jgi:hypothetical protein
VAVQGGVELARPSSRIVVVEGRDGAVFLCIRKEAWRSPEPLSPAVDTLLIKLRKPSKKMGSVKILYIRVYKVNLSVYYRRVIGNDHLEEGDQ